MPSRHGRRCAVEQSTSEGLARFEGWDHFGCGPWHCELPIPAGYAIIQRYSGDITQVGDMCMVGVPPFPKRRRNKPPYSCPTKGRWEQVAAENIGKPMCNFRIVIRPS